MKRYIDKAILVAEIEKLKSNLIYGACASQIAMETRCKEEAYNEVLSLLDTLEVKEIDLENSIVCEVGWYDGFFLDYTQEQQDALLEKIGDNVGDKVRIILIKE